jgi:8-oxo-dGTP pyrophosphatase MutT (NUDIX family)
VDVVAVVLCWRGRIGLFKRSQSVAHDRGLWHCLTGYLDRVTDSQSALRQAQLELEEEVGLTGDDLEALVSGPVLHLHGDGRDWRVHTFRAITTTRRLTLNWEHVEYLWARPSTIPRFDGRVAWLADVIQAVAPRVTTTSDAPALLRPLRRTPRTG